MVRDHFRLVSIAINEECVCEQLERSSDIIRMIFRLAFSSFFPPLKTELWYRWVVDIGTVIALPASRMFLGMRMVLFYIVSCIIMNLLTS